MKALILAGGFATRIYPLTICTPKPLLPIVGKPIIQYIIEKIELIEDINEIFISTNKRFEKHFNNWLSHFSSRKYIKLVIEDSKEEKEKLGPVCALKFLIEKEKMNEDLLIVAGDNLFDFKFGDMLDYYTKKKASVVAFYDITDIDKAKRFGVAELDKLNRLMSLEEKPDKPATTLVSTGCYIFSEDSLKRINEYLMCGNNPDALGSFLAWLIKKENIYGFRFKDKWFDIGHIDDYKAANDEYESRF